MGLSVNGILKFVLAMIFAVLSLNEGFSSSSHYEALIFDVDGVLVDTEKLKYEAWREALQEEGVDFRVEEYYGLVGLSSKDILKAIVVLKQRDISEDLIAKKDSYYHAKQKMGVPLMPEGVKFLKDAIQSRSAKNIKVALASSAPMKEILENVKQMGLNESDFDCIASGKDSLNHIYDPEGVNKPKPYIYQYVAEKMGVMPKNCIVFEDTNAGVAAAASAQMNVYAVPNEFTKNQDFLRARRVINFEKIKIVDVLEDKIAEK